ncbi:bifunctional folylpolyglutamate synthase/dihydrofolate synthase [Candidatus Deianiraea vastatrix]|uniref:FolC-like protein (N-terminal domain) n=1 Tax=Candidatus Deianiraea vastatrix TaxID=2163644 RepID=A0A5B8XEJ0_9RICK|nr:Mur ligase family protein [Candidatus Deianiraea vastatrix]QED23683.1 FolC-like protein (N-terminal domain) [Candidatus Deianiraea vastatrix]
MAKMPHWPLYLGANKERVDSREKVLRVLSALHDPHMDLRNIIHITGTNGKGSTAGYISEILKQSGYKVGRYTSPHIHICNERICINDEMISDIDLYEIIEEIRVICERQGIDLTIFEATTLCAFIYFRRNECDFNVIEVGMGGMIDATNVFDENRPICSIITPIHLDHVKYLGASMEEIAFQKAFIIKGDSLCICAHQSESVEKLIELRCEAVGSKVYFEGRDFSGSYIEENEDEWLFSMHFEKYGRDIMRDIVLPRPSLAGWHQIGNASIATMACIEISARLGIEV